MAVRSTHSISSRSRRSCTSRDSEDTKRRFRKTCHKNCCFFLVKLILDLRTKKKVSSFVLKSMSVPTCHQLWFVYLFIFIICVRDATYEWIFFFIHNLWNWLSLEFNMHIFYFLFNVLFQWRQQKTITYFIIQYFLVYFRMCLFFIYEWNKIFV
jgi:hypothetical protein